MSDQLADLAVLALDCQTSGATPAHGDLLELGWGVCAATGVVGPVQSRWIVPRTARPIPRAVRELTSWTEACVLNAVPERDAWHALSDAVASMIAPSHAGPAPQETTNGFAHRRGKAGRGRDRRPAIRA